MVGHGVAKILQFRQLLYSNHTILKILISMSILTVQTSLILTDYSAMTNEQLNGSKDPKDYDQTID